MRCTFSWSAPCASSSSTRMPSADAPSPVRAHSGCLQASASRRRPAWAWRPRRASSCRKRLVAATRRQLASAGAAAASGNPTAAPPTPRRSLPAQVLRARPVRGCPPRRSFGAWGRRRGPRPARARLKSRTAPTCRGGCSSRWRTRRTSPRSSSQAPRPRSSPRRCRLARPWARWATARGSASRATSPTGTADAGRERHASSATSAVRR
mmetsp:Transcript_15830/g.32083  ORF Transcript_15830/g.32083 Transcript_15830/m.32083 type:complete len:209 (+) Transcript_15830:111-737(+)